jgi:RNA polymerase sigma-70 factor (ECF subfamily)
LKFKKNSSGITAVKELELLAEYRSTGNIELLGLLYEQYMPLIFGLCLKYFRDEEQSKDAVMQIFEELVNKLKVHEVTNFKGWLYTLSRNHCLMILRTSSKHQMISIDENVMESEAFVHLNLEDDNEVKLTTMAKCIEILQPEQRTTINLFYMEQKCYKEVADLTGFDLKKVKSYIQNGKRNLKNCIDKNSEH